MLRRRPQPQLLLSYKPGHALLRHTLRPDLLLIHCRNRQVMGALVNRRATTVIATVVVTLIVSLNVFLLYQTFFS
jgi:hypothetical protein